MTTPAALRGRLSRGPRGPVRAPAFDVLVALVVAVLAVAPFVYLGIRAFEGGVDALSPLLRARTLELVISTLTLGVAVGAGAIGLGVPMAWLTTRTDLPRRRTWSVLAIAPLAIPSYLLAFAFVGAFAPRGWLNDALMPFGIAVPGVYGFGGAVLVLTLATLPYVVVATRAAFARLDPSTEEAARSLGRGPWGAARAAVLPVILPAVGAGSLLAMLYAISDFGAVSILRYDTLPTAIYSQYRFSFDRSAAAVLALALMVLALSLVGVEARIRRRAAQQVATGRRREARVVRLGWWRWPALMLMTSVALLSIGIPMMTVGLWLADGLARGIDPSLRLDALRDSLILGIGAATLAVAVALPLAHLVVRYQGRLPMAVERLLYATYALPGISLALAVVAFTLDLVPALYQTLAVLVLAVGTRFLVQAVGALRTPMLQVSPRTLEAARSLGEGPFGVVRTVSLPLLRPGILAGAALVFLSALKELPLTLLLAPPGFGTLATDLWDTAREAFYRDAAVPATLLLVVSLASVSLLIRRGEVEA